MPLEPDIQAAARMSHDSSKRCTNGSLGTVWPTCSHDVGTSAQTFLLCGHRSEPLIGHRTLTALDHVACLEAAIQAATRALPYLHAPGKCRQLTATAKHEPKQYEQAIRGAASAGPLPSETVSVVHEHQLRYMPTTPHADGRRMHERQACAVHCWPKMVSARPSRTK